MLLPNKVVIFHSSVRNCLFMLPPDTVFLFIYLIIIPDGIMHLINLVSIVLLRVNLSLFTFICGMFVLGHCRFCLSPLV